MKHKVKVVYRHQASPNHLNWDRVARYVLPPMLLGFGLAVWQPLSLIPPLKPMTGLLYALCALAWAPVFIYYQGQEPSGETWKQYALLGAGIIPIFIALSLLLGTFNAFNFEQKCQPLNTANWFTQNYECRTDFPNSTYLNETFESLRFTPLMWRIDKKNCSLNGCY